MGSTAFGIKFSSEDRSIQRSLRDELIRVLGIFRTGPIRGPRATCFTGKYGTVFILLRK